MRSLSPLYFVLAALLALPTALLAQGNTSIINSPHNLSAGGPGAIRAADETEICIFCHTPHNSAPVTPLWNRTLPMMPYTVYSSNSLQSVPGQPTGSSKLCLSCHDGTIALGNVLSREMPINMTGGITALPSGPSNLGTDLSGDHPISFVYDANLVTRNPRLKDPGTLTGTPVKLDRQRELQCTACHDAHSNQFGKFLVMDNSASQLCSTCHLMGTTTVTNHVQCASCHQSHQAPSGPYLLRGRTVSDTCTVCHNGTTSPTQGVNIQADLNKLSRHDTATPVTLKTHAPNAVACNDCHEGHTMQSGGLTAAPAIAANLGRIDGITAAGAAIPQARFEYEVCFKCHGDQAATLNQPPVSRQVPSTNLRLQLSPTAISFHPVETAGKSLDVPSLRTGYTTASLIYCGDCHASDSGVGGAKGPHGSNTRPLLIDVYDTTDNTPESATAYALCYRCHDRSSILSNQSFSKHSSHVVDKATPCSACHDGHGIASAQGTTSNNAHLINFDVSIVQPDPLTKRLQYQTLGARSGQCYLSCHGVAHSPKQYP